MKKKKIKKSMQSACIAAASDLECVLNPDTFSLDARRLDDYVADFMDGIGISKSKYFQYWYSIYNLFKAYIGEVAYYCEEWRIETYRREIVKAAKNLHDNEKIENGTCSVKEMEDRLRDTWSQLDIDKEEIERRTDCIGKEAPLKLSILQVYVDLLHDCSDLEHLGKDRFLSIEQSLYDNKEQFHDPMRKMNPALEAMDTFMAAPQEIRNAACQCLLTELEWQIEHGIKAA